MKTKKMQQTVPSLIARAKAGEPAARHELVQAHMAFIFRTAKAFAFGNESMREDLVAYGIVGFLEGLERFDESRGIKLLTFAAYYVRVRIQSASLAAATPLSGAVAANERSRAIMKAYREASEGGIGHDAAVAAAGSALGKKEGFVRSVIERRQRTFSSRSLDEPIGSDGGAFTLLDVQTNGAPSAEEVVAETSEHVRVRAIIDRLKLPVADKIIIEFRLVGGETLQRVGQRLGLSRERVRQREHALIPVLREALSQAGIVRPQGDAPRSRRSATSDREDTSSRSQRLVA
jgi:RNA polymerase sigma factor (sigma-70 family)